MLSKQWRYYLSSWFGECQNDEGFCIVDSLVYPSSN